MKEIWLFFFVYSSLVIAVEELFVRKMMAAQEQNDSDWQKLLVLILHIGILTFLKSFYLQGNQEKQKRPSHRMDLQLWCSVFVFFHLHFSTVGSGRYRVIQGYYALKWKIVVIIIPSVRNGMTSDVVLGVVDGGASSLRGLDGCFARLLLDEILYLTSLRNNQSVS